ncbi:MAG TPA: hypothetical protein VGN84_03680 [Solirubrobacterales bacterium]|nr:hypothetical protein [Solirubrobacterales bacterium]
MPNLYVGHSSRDRGALVTHLWLADAGVVTQVAKVKTVQGARTVCSVRAIVPNGGARDLRCSLSSEVLTRLRSHDQTLRVRTTFAPQAGDPDSIVGRVRLPRNSP